MTDVHLKEILTRQKVALAALWVNLDMQLSNMRGLLSSTINVFLDNLPLQEDFQCMRSMIIDTDT